MKVQDVITYEPKLFGIIEKKETADIIYDENYFTLLRAVREKPRTPEELVEIYENLKNPKSLMTIYRYIRILTKHGLVTEGGKRIITDEQNRNRTETLFVATTRIVYISLKDAELEHNIDTIRRREVEVYSQLLEMLTKKESASMECINKIINDVYFMGQAKLTEIMDTSDKDLHKYLADFGLMMTNTLIVHIGWMSLILERDIKELLLKCIK
ncbi:MAG: hypothetical protein FK731_06335 [Asgard group archaeon]|nr:hypothetical protein [Asgard group archaeon]